jgi:hypothetical protein
VRSAALSRSLLSILPPDAALENANSAAYLDKCRAVILENLRSLEAAPGVAFQSVPPDFIIREADEEAVAAGSSRSALSAAGAGAGAGSGYALDGIGAPAASLFASAALSGFTAEEEARGGGDRGLYREGRRADAAAAGGAEWYEHAADHDRDTQQEKEREEAAAGRSSSSSRGGRSRPRGSAGPAAGAVGRGSRASGSAVAAAAAPAGEAAAPLAALEEALQEAGTGSGDAAAAEPVDGGEAPPEAGSSGGGAGGMERVDAGEPEQGSLPVPVVLQAAGVAQPARDAGAVVLPPVSSADAAPPLSDFGRVSADQFAADISEGAGFHAAGEAEVEGLLQGWQAAGPSTSRGAREAAASMQLDTAAPGAGAGGLSLLEPAGRAPQASDAAAGAPGLEQAAQSGPQEPAQLDAEEL